MLYHPDESCDDIQCLNNGTCDHDDSGRPYCSCSTGFAGSRCEIGKTNQRERESVKYER